MQCVVVLTEVVDWPEVCMAVTVEFASFSCQLYENKISSMIEESLQFLLLCTGCLPVYSSPSHPRLGCNKIADAGAEALAEALQHNNSLQKLE